MLSIAMRKLRHEMRCIKDENDTHKSKIAMNLRWKVVRSHKEERFRHGLSENYQETWKLSRKQEALT